jgi:processive 1,2-diacylglycerol beta-glucosyltransferase
MDRTGPLGPDHWYRLRVFLEQMNVHPFLKLLTEERWDLVINTFFLPAEIVASLRRQGRVTAPQVLIVTDFETHRNWIADPCERIFTATHEAALYLQHFGVPASATAVTGIPVHPAFSEPRDRTTCLRRHGLRGDRPIVLLLAGGHGVGPLQDAYQAVLDIGPPVEIVVVTGHNAKAKEHLEAIVPPARHRVRVLGYSSQMDELFAVADLAVTKPGGLTVSEALARGVGLVIINPIQGQETRNSDYLLENGAAIKVNHLPTLAYKVNELLTFRGKLAHLKENARRLGRPRAAFDIVNRSLELLPDAQRDSGHMTRASGNGAAHVGLSAGSAGG